MVVEIALSVGSETMTDSFSTTFATFLRLDAGKSEALFLQVKNSVTLDCAILKVLHFAPVCCVTCRKNIGQCLISLLWNLWMRMRFEMKLIFRRTYFDDSRKYRKCDHRSHDILFSCKSNWKVFLILFGIYHLAINKRSCQEQGIVLFRQLAGKWMVRPVCNSQIKFVYMVESWPERLFCFSSLVPWSCSLTFTLTLHWHHIFRYSKCTKHFLEFVTVKAIVCLDRFFLPSGLICLSISYMMLPVALHISRSLC